MRGRDPVLGEWGWELEEPALAVSARAASALVPEALSWRAHYPRRPVVLLTYGHVFAVTADAQAHHSKGRLAPRHVACVGDGSRGSLVHVWSTGPPTAPGYWHALS